MHLRWEKMEYLYLPEQIEEISADLIIPTVLNSNEKVSFIACGDDFYELFFEDAITVAGALGLTLTRSSSNNMMMRSTTMSKSGLMPKTTSSPPDLNCRLTC